MKSMPNTTGRDPVSSGVFLDPPRATIHYPLSTIRSLLPPGAPCWPDVAEPEPGSQAEPVARPLEGLKLRLAVVDDPALAAAVVRVHGEWNAQTGAEFQVEQVTEKDLANAEALPADAVLCPSHLLGGLAERKLLAPVPPPILHDAEWGGIFELLRLREAAWANEIMAVPFGSPVFCCYYRADLLEKLGRRPPRTWAEYQDLAKLLAEEGRAERGEGRRWCGTIEPLAPGWADSCSWPEPHPMPNTATTTPRCSTSTRWSRWWPARRWFRHWRSLSPRPNSAPRSVPLRSGGGSRGVLGGAVRDGADLAHGSKRRGKGEGGRGRAGRFSDQFSNQFTESADSRGLRRITRLAAGIQPQRIRMGHSAGRRRSAGALAGDLRPAGRGQCEVGPHPGRLPIAALALRQPHESADQRGQPGDDALPAVEPEIARPMGGETGFRRWRPCSTATPPRPHCVTSSGSARCVYPAGPNIWPPWTRPWRQPSAARKPPLDALLQADKKWREITARLGLDRQRAAYRHSLGLGE